MTEGPWRLNADGQGEQKKAIESTRQAGGSNTPRPRWASGIGDPAPGSDACEAAICAFGSPEVRIGDTGARHLPHTSAAATSRSSDLAHPARPSECA